MAKERRYTWFDCVKYTYVPGLEPPPPEPGKQAWMYVGRRYPKGCEISDCAHTPVVRERIVSEMECLNFAYAQGWPEARRYTWFDCVPYTYHVTIVRRLAPSREPNLFLR